MKVPPRELLIQVSNDPSPDNYRNVASVVWAVEQPLIAAGYRFADFDRILDFGCGAGRLLQALNLSRREGQELWGCDVNEACATWCKDNLDFATVAHTALAPPLPYADDSFDLIVAISVFTHLSRPLQVAWARELMRVLRPGGVALVTTWGLGILPDVLAINDAWSVREFALLGATGNFLHFAEGDASALEGQREVVALHAHDAIAQIFSPLELALHADITAIAGGQDASLLVKPENGCRVITDDDPMAPAQGVSAQVSANAKASNIVTQQFAPGHSGPSRFKSYIAMDGRRFDLVHLAVECRVRSAESGKTLAEGRFAFPSSVTLGSDHYVPFSVDLGETPQSVEVELAVSLRRAPWQADPIMFRWWDSRIEIGGRALREHDAAKAAGMSKRTDLEMIRLNEPLIVLAP